MALLASLWHFWQVYGIFGKFMAFLARFWHLMAFLAFCHFLTFMAFFEVFGIFGNFKNLINFNISAFQYQWPQHTVQRWRTAKPEPALCRPGGMREFGPVGQGQVGQNVGQGPRKTGVKEWYV